MKKATKSTTTKTRWDKFEELSLELAKIKGEKKALTLKEQELQAELLDVLEKTGQQTHVFTDNGQSVRVTRVQSSTMIIDEPRLKKRLGTAGWNRISTRMFDKRKLDLALRDGLIKATIVAECSEQKESSPFIKISR